MSNLKSAFLIPRHLYSALSTGIFCWLLAFSLGGSQQTLAFSILIGLALGFLVQSFSAILTGLFISLVSCTFMALVAETFKPNYSIDASIVLTFFLILTIVASFSIKRIIPMMDEKVFLLPVLGLGTVLFALLRASRTWTSEGAFGFLVRSGEDNAAWLVALSRSVVDGTTQLSSASGTSGGPGTGIVINLVRQLMDVIGETPLVSNADNGLVLIKSYVVLSIVLAFLWLIATLTSSKSHDDVAKTLFSVSSSILSYLFLMGLASVGHFSAVVAVVFLAVAVYSYLVIGGHSRWTIWLKRITVFASLVAAGQSWFPLTGLALFYLLAICALEMAPLFHRGLSRRSIEIILVVTAVLSIFGYISYTRLFPSFLQNVFKLEFITYNLTLPGGYATVNSWIVIISFVVVVLWGTSTQVNQFDKSYWVLPAVLIGPTVALFVWSYFLAPFTPQYGAWKYLYISTAVAAPMSVAVAMDLFPRHLPKNYLRAFPIILLLFVAMFSPPWNSIRWAEGMKGGNYPWVSTVVRELKSSPTTPVGCLNTIAGDESQNYTGYLCSRMAFGLGGFDEVRHRVWTAGSICTISNGQTAFEWPREKQKKFTVLLFDGSRTSSLAGCQASTKQFPYGWLSGIDWSVIRKLDQNGKVVNISQTMPDKK